MTRKTDPIDFLNIQADLPAEYEQNDHPIEKYCPCPECGQEMDHYRNVGRDHFGVCLSCNVIFLVGSNLFSSWKEEDESTWADNKKYLSQFKLVE
jgi:hypothetical protein